MLKTFLKSQLIGHKKRNTIIRDILQFGLPCNHPGLKTLMFVDKSAVHSPKRAIFS